MQSSPYTLKLNQPYLHSFCLMKLPSVTSQNNLAIDNISGNHYEPNSVLDIRRSQSSPVTGNSSELDCKPEKLPVEEWDSDSLMRELGLYDESSISDSGYHLGLPELPPCFHSDFDFETLDPDLNRSINQNMFDLMNLMNKEEYEDTNNYDFKTELIRLAECVETQSFQPVQVILARLNQRLGSVSPNAKPLQRAAFYFKEAIQSLVNGSTRSFKSCTSFEIVQMIKAYKMYCTVSPIPMFCSFTANQAILDAVDGVMSVHVIDFDIGFGGQWASFLKGVAEKAEARKVRSAAVRITAVVPEEFEAESRLIRDNLCQFSRDLKLRFNIDFVSVGAFEFASFKTIRFVNGERTAVVLSPTIFQRVGSGFVNDLRRVSPNVVVYVDGELNGCGMPLFSKMVTDGLELYTTILESLEAANGVGGVDESDWLRSIEMFVLLPKIIAMVENTGRHVSPWREAFGRAGMQPVGMSQFAEFQAECLVRRVQVRGFHVMKQQTEMMLCWHDRPLVATSVWRF